MFSDRKAGRIIRRTGFGKQPKNSIPLNTKGHPQRMPYFTDPQPGRTAPTIENHSYLRSSCGSSPRQNGINSLHHRFIRISNFAKYSNGNAQKIWLRRLVVLSLQKTGKRFGNLCVQAPHDCFIFHYL